MASIEAAIDEMKAVLGVELDRDLAAALQIDATAVAAWRRRGTLPQKYRIRFLRRSDEFASSDDHGQTSSSNLRNTYVFAIIALANSSLNKSAPFAIKEEDDFQLAWVGHRMANLYEKLLRRLDHRLEKDDLRQRFDELRSELSSSSDVEAWIASLG